MASWQEQPRVGQSIWDDHRNGIITGIDYQQRIVYADYYEKGRGEYSIDDLLGSFDEALNQWVLVEA